jgi:hypothetical protein
MFPKMNRPSFHWPATFVVLVLLAASTGWAQSSETNSISDIRSRESGIEVELTSSRPFLQSNLPVLRVGEQEFTISRYPDDGNLNRLIFVLTPEQFAQIRAGENAEFQYGRGQAHQKRSFGRIDKARLRK